MNKKPTPTLTINDRTKFYLAADDVTPADSENFLIASLYLPRDTKTGQIMLVPQTEVSAFEKPEWAVLYKESIECLCKINKNSKLYKDVSAMFAEKISNFKQR